MMAKWRVTSALAQNESQKHENQNDGEGLAATDDKNLQLLK